MLTQEDDIDAHALRKRGWSISAIARHLGRDRKTIRAYLSGDRTAGVRTPAGDDAFAAASVLVACLLELPPQPVASAPTPAARAAATTTRRNRVIDGRSERSRPENGGGHTTRSVD
jgi:transposase